MTKPVNIDLDGNEDWLKTPQTIAREETIHDALELEHGQKQLTSPGANEYRRSLRAAVKGLYQGKGDFDWYADAMEAAISHSFNRAFRDGAAKCGIKPADYSQDEKTALDDAISNEFKYVEGLGIAVVAAKAEDVGTKGLFARLELWIQRYLELGTLAMQMACADQKLKFVLDPAKENCWSCVKLNNQVRRASRWQDFDCRPQHPDLDCTKSAGGVTVCGCEFEPTDDPCSRGPLPKWRA